MIDVKEHSAVLRLNKTEGILKFLLSIGQSSSNIGVREDMILITKNVELIYRFIDDIPGLKDLLDEYSLFENYSTKNSMDVTRLYGLVPGVPSKETKDKALKLKLKHKVVSKWTRELSKTVFRLRENGEMVLPQANPNRKGKHYLTALNACRSISKLWFVKEVKIFGSVAKGLERADSDVDISVETFDGRAAVANALQFIERDLNNKLKLTISLLIQTPQGGKKNKKFFNEVGFFEASETLFKRCDWEFLIGKTIVSFSETDYRTYSFGRDCRGKKYYCLKFGKENKDSYVVMINDKPVAYYDREKRAERKRTMIAACLPEIVTSTRKLTFVEEKVIEGLIAKLEDKNS